MRISDWSSDVCSSDLRPRPGLLKNNIRLLLQTAGNLERPGVIGGPIDVAGGNLAVENLVTVQKIIAAVNGGERLFLCSHHPAEGHRAFRGEEVSMLPTRLHTEAFARAITHLSRDGARRSEDHPSELSSLMRNSYAVFGLDTKTTIKTPPMEI